MSQPLVSVIVPVYNGERFVTACIDSIVSQSVQDIEILLVDDGSTDATPRLLDEYAARDSRIRIIHQKNAGVSQARNAALDAAQGKYIRFADCDDVLPPDSLHTLLEKSQNNSSDLVIAAYTEVVGAYRKLKDMNRSERTQTCDEFLHDLCRRPNSFCYGVLWNKLYSRALIEKHNIRFVPGMTWGEDFMFNMQYLTHATRVSYTSTPVYDYYRNPTGLTFSMLLGCITKPFHSLRMKLVMHKAYIDLYKTRGLYPAYRFRLWQHLVTFTLSN